MPKFSVGNHPTTLSQCTSSNAAALAIHQILCCELTGPFRRSLYRLKALELTCRVLHALADPTPSAGRLTQEEIERVDRALAIIQAQLDTPLTINELGPRSGLIESVCSLGFAFAMAIPLARSTNGSEWSARSS